MSSSCFSFRRKNSHFKDSDFTMEDLCQLSRCHTFLPTHRVPLTDRWWVCSFNQQMNCVYFISIMMFNWSSATTFVPSASIRKVTVESNCFYPLELLMFGEVERRLLRLVWCNEWYQRLWHAVGPDTKQSDGGWEHCAFISLENRKAWFQNILRHKALCLQAFNNSQLHLH